MALSKQLTDALNAEVGLEFYAHSQYLAMAHWFETRGLDGLATFFYNQAEEEKMHGVKIVRYISEVGGDLRIPAIDAPKHDFASALEVAQLFLSQEEHVTQQFFKMNRMAVEEGDYITQDFLQWFITEQREEMATAGKLVDLFKMAGDNLLQVELLIDRLAGGQDLTGEGGGEG